MNLQSDASDFLLRYYSRGSAAIERRAEPLRLAATFGSVTIRASAEQNEEEWSGSEAAPHRSASKRVCYVRASRSFPRSRPFADDLTLYCA